MNKREKFYYVLWIIVGVMTMFPSIAHGEITYNGEKNVEKEMIVTPRGNPTRAKKAESRSMEHTSFESTGLFLYQGEELEIIVEDEPENLEARIGQWGGYNDVPYILNGTQTKPFTNGIFPLHKGSNIVKRDESGGMVYLVNYSDKRLEKVVIKGGVKVPHYVEGETTTEEFERQLEEYKDVPFMEMENGKAIATIRIDRAKDIFQKKGQEKIFMDTLAKVIELSNESVGLSENAVGVAKKANQRIHIVNPSFGPGTLFATNYFLGIHSGSTKDRVIFSSDGQLPDWGLIHEVGHTYQNPNYQWKNMAEVTVNISADYVQRNWSEQGTGRYDAVNSSNGSRASVQQFFNHVQTDPSWTFDRETLETNKYHFAVLGLFVTLPRVFGYDFYAVLNQNYRSLLDEERPTSELEQKQLFIWMASKVAKRDLLPLFDYWHFTVTEETRNKIKEAHLPPLEKEVWHDILASKEEEEAGVYRISESVGPYTLPYIEAKESVYVPFEKSGDSSVYESILESPSSIPIPNPTTILSIAGRLTPDLEFGEQPVYAYLENAIGIKNKIGIPVTITPGNAYVMSGQKGKYAVLGYNAEKKELTAVGNDRKILQNIPGNMYPDIKIYSRKMDVLKKEVVGYGRDTGEYVAGELEGTPVEVGDIIEIYHKQAPIRVTRYKDGQKIPTTKEKYYYRILEDQWMEVDDPHDLTTLQVEDKVIYAGQKWEDQMAVISATDYNGEPLDFQKIKVSGMVDSSKVGSYPLTYTNGTITKTVTVTVKEKQFALSWDNNEEQKEQDKVVDPLDIGEEGYISSFYWQPVATDKVPVFVLKKGDRVVWQAEGSHTEGISEQHPFVLQQFSIPKKELDYGENIFTLEVYLSNNQGEPLEKVAQDTLTMTITVSGAVFLEEYPDLLKWTNRSSSQMMGIIPRDEENALRLKVRDTSPADSSSWYVTAQAKIVSQTTPPFEMIWKNTETASETTSLMGAPITVFRRPENQKGVWFEKTWDQSSGVLLKNDSWLDSGDYSRQIEIEWTLVNIKKAQ